ncbi:MAG: GNAT family protein [Patescibacteria group bacterium]|jgi:RimJ/RimL family protein N-acetyltransferase
MYGPKIKFAYDRGEKSGGRVEVELGSPADEVVAAKQFTEWINDNRIRLYLATPAPCTESAEMDWVKNQNNRPDDLSWNIMIEGEMVGNIGLHRIDRTHRRAELGIMIGDKKRWGKGLAQALEAVILDYAFSNIVAGGLNKVAAEVLDGNEPSRAAIKKCGFRDVAVRREHFWFFGRWYDAWEGEILASEWSKNRAKVMKAVGIKYLDLYCGCASEGFTPEKFD